MFTWVALQLATGNEAGTAPEDRTFRPDIEGLRAIAVLWVVLFHTGDLHMVGGYVGVDVFFVISGFVITGVLLREQASAGKPTLLKFYGRRVARIVPMATVVIVVALITERVVAGARLAHGYASSARWAALFGANIRPSFLFGTYWSLAVEEQFYLVYPAVFLLVVFAFRQWSLRAKLGAVLTAIVVSSFAWSEVHPAAAYTSPFGRAWELAVGALLAVLTGYLKRMSSPVAVLATWSGLAGLVAIGLSLNFSYAYPGGVAALPVTAAALVIAGGTAAPRGGAESLLRLAPFKWLGRWSYSLYLWHWPVILIAAQHWGHMDALRKTVLAGIAVLLSAISYFTIENPVRHSEFLRRSPWVAIIMGLVFIAICFGVTFAF